MTPLSIGRRHLEPSLLLIIVTLIMWLLRSTLSLANFGAIYILAVLILAIRRGTRTALAAAFVSFLCLNFFLVQPYYTFAIEDPREVIDLFVFLTSAVLVGQLAARARQQTQAAQQRAYEQEILYRLTQTFNQIASADQVQEALLEMLKSDLGVRLASVLPDTAPPQPIADGATHYLVLQMDDQIYGTLCVVLELEPSSEKLRLLHACAYQAAMALRRIELTERARKSQQFEEADRMKTALLHAVSHDLRTPVTVIKTSASNLSRLGEQLAPDERRELSQTIEDEADQLDDLIGELLDMSRLRAGALQLNLAMNSLEEVAGDAAARAFQRTKQERIRLNFPDDLPLVLFDYRLLLQALINLVDNSLRYEPPESRIELRGEAAGGEARLVIVNHGRNLTADERTHIMEPFFRGQEGHVGLGLAIAKGIIEAHHGRLWAEDTLGGGVTFEMALPLEQEGDYGAQCPGG